MPDLAPHHLLAIVATVVCLLCIGLLANWLDKRTQRRKRAQQEEARRMYFRRYMPQTMPRPGESRREHIERLARLRDWAEAERTSTAFRRTQTPPRPAPTTNPGPGLRPHPVYGTDTHRPWVIPPASMAEPATLRGVGDSFAETVPGADWKPAGGEFGGAGASGSWDTPSTDTATTASTAE